MKKIISFILIMCICLSAAAILSGCSHEHTFDAWSASPESHWHVCTECGEKSDEGKHSTNEENMCTVCGAGVYLNDDGSASIYTYDEQGSMLEQTEYGADGEMYYRRRFVNEYYEDGNPKSVTEYEYDILNESDDEILVGETKFLPCENPENGEVYMSESTAYDEDGSKVCMTYDEQFNVLSVTTYDSEGNVVLSERYEYEYDSEGNYTKETIYKNDVISGEVIYSRDEDGTVYESARIYYKENGEIESETHYDAFGNEIE